MTVRLGPAASEAREVMDAVRGGRALERDGPRVTRAEPFTQGVGARLATERVERRLLPLVVATGLRGVMGLIFGAWFLATLG